MAQTRTITAVDPATGARITRRTARTYVGVVVTGDPAQGKAWPQNWYGRPDLAAKQLAKWGPDSHARLAPVVEDPWAEPVTAEPAPVVAEAQEDLALALAEPVATTRPTLPGEALPPAPPAPHGAAAPELPTLPPPAGAGVAAHRAAAAAGRPVSLAALAHDLGRSLGLAVAQAPTRSAPTGEGLAGQPGDPGTPEARATVALQGERVGILWPIAQALRGEGVALPPSWATDGPVMGGELTLADALARLPLGAIAQAAAALAALPPVTAAQDAALALCRIGAVPGRPYL